MAQPSVIPQKLMTAALLHFTQGVPIDDCDCLPEQKKRLARVSHVYWIWKRNPFLETLPMFKQLTRKQYATQSNEIRAAKEDQILFDFVKDQCSPVDRKMQEERVRFAANHLMKIGMETDNTFAIEAGMKGAIKIDRLDQPESERAEMSRAAFLPPVVTTSAHEVDDTKEDMDDKQSLAIMNKYDAYVDEKRKMIEDRVAVMEAKRKDAEEISTDNAD